MALIEQSGLTEAHDPTIVKENGIYYRFQTGRGLPFFSSSDMRTWRNAGRIFRKNPVWSKRAVPGSRSFWAPEIVRRDGWWRVYYSVSTFGKNRSAIGLVRSRTLDTASPDYGWEDMGPVIRSRPDHAYNCIDPAVFRDTDGHDKFLFGSFWGGLKVLDLDGAGFVAPDQKPRTLASRLTVPNPIEGGFVFPHGGLFYLFASADYCCRGIKSSYRILYGCSQSAEGPYLDESGHSMAEGGGTQLRDGASFPRWAGPGHCSVFQDDDGRTFLVYHAYDRRDRGKPKLQIEEIRLDGGLAEFV